MTDSVFSVDTMINLVQKLRQEKAEREKAISQTKQKARVLERRGPGRWGWPPLLRRRIWP